MPRATGAAGAQSSDDIATEKVLTAAEAERRRRGGERRRTRWSRCGGTARHQRRTGPTEKSLR
ncbi:hypothetical protein [Streptomyces sp. KL116D]|uniref:hypothetical protein n=1 Tax=Streptomyces sp. KL116D TaxID=3045152 RepID=UPI003557CA6B